MLALATLCTGACTLVAGGLSDSLVSGGFEATGTESARAESFVRTEFRNGPPDLTLLIETAASVDDFAETKTGKALTERLRNQPGVVSARSYWDEDDPVMRAQGGGRRALITVLLSGSENDRVASARRLVPDFTGRQGPLLVGATGPAWVGAQVTDDSQHDLLKTEFVSAPLILIALIIVFRSIIGAAIPLLVAAAAAAATFALLRPLAALMPLSVFSTNLAAALGFGLTVDYCLFLITRYRHEVGQGHTPEQAICISTRTAGRATVFSAVTIAAAMAALLCFPVPFLRSMACAGLSVALCAAAASYVLIPPLLVVLGHRLDRGDLFGRVTRPSRVTAGAPGQAGAFWSAAAHTVTKRPALCGVGALLVLTGLLAPCTHLKLGPLDERILPSSAQAHVVADQVRTTFPYASGSTLVIAAPHTQWSRNSQGWDAYARAWSRSQPSGVIITPEALYHAGKVIGPGDRGMLHQTGGAWLAAAVPHPPESAPAQAAVREARTLTSPDNTHVGGDAARLIDTRNALKGALPTAAAIAIVCTALLLFCLTGSVFLPLKAIAVAALSMSACFGTVIWAFQDGNIGSVLGEFTVTGTVNASILLLVLCIAFGLSMDYETFLLASIQEEYCISSDNRSAVEAGIAQTGRLVTVAAFAVATAMAGLATSSITPLKILGFGLTIGVLVDATLVRTILVPASMCLAGQANWWAPTPLRGVSNHRRIR